jgi:hypothetical protein
MRGRIIVLVLAAVVLATSLPAMAELQNVTVGGQLRIRGNYYRNAYTSAPEVSWPGFFLPARPIGSVDHSIVSFFDWNDAGNDLDFVEQRTRLNVNADFTDEVSAFIELDSYDIWGEDFRSNYITGADARANTGDDVEVYQAYIQAKEMWGTPLQLRVGRQELSFGNQWLVGVNDASSTFQGLSFDAVRLTYDTDQFSVDAWASKLFEANAAEEDGDTDFYGVYATYKGIENVTLDAYWMFLRDASSRNDTNGNWLPELLENWLNLDDYDVTNLHTVGLRGAGTFGAFDFNAEAAYQFGDADRIGSFFKAFTYGDDDAEFSEWGANLELGYTFDMAYKPRVYIGGAYLGGEDNRGVSFWEWLSPFDKPDASVSFNRLFSNWEYSEFLENSDLSNVWVARAGVSASPVENVDLLLAVTYFQSLDDFDAPRHIKIGRYRVPLNPDWSFWTEKNDDSLGTEVGLYATYHYSEDLTFNAGWAHLFVDDGLEEGNFNALNGLGFDGGTGSDDADYVFLESVLKF